MVNCDVDQAYIVPSNRTLIYICFSYVRHVNVDGLLTVAVVYVSEFATISLSV